VRHPELLTGEFGVALGAQWGSGVVVGRCWYSKGMTWAMLDTTRPVAGCVSPLTVAMSRDGAAPVVHDSASAAACVR
jgi:hypothetical protein